jgi:hypothetical protein
VTNTSRRDGDEVVELYQAVDGGLPALAGMQRVHIAAGTSRIVEFTLDANPAGGRGSAGRGSMGRVSIMIGGGPPAAGPSALK